MKVLDGSGGSSVHIKNVVQWLIINLRLINLKVTTAQELRSTPLEWLQKSSGTRLRMRPVLDTLLRTRSLSHSVPRRAIQLPSLSGPVCARIRNQYRHLF